MTFWSEKPTESNKKTRFFSSTSKILETERRSESISVYFLLWKRSFHIKSRSEERQSTGSLVSAVVLWRVRYYTDVASLWREGTLTVLKYLLVLITIDFFYENVSHFYDIIKSQFRIHQLQFITYIFDFKSMRYTTIYFLSVSF